MYVAAAIGGCDAHFTREFVIGILARDCIQRTKASLIKNTAAFVIFIALLSERVDLVIFSAVLGNFDLHFVE